MTCQNTDLEYTLFFYTSNTFMYNTRLKFAKNQANAKQHPDAELQLIDNYLNSSPTLSSKINRTYSKKRAKKQACIYS